VATISGTSVKSATSNTVCITVNQAENTIAIKPTTGLVYNGTEQELVQVINVDGIDSSIRYYITARGMEEPYTVNWSNRLPVGLNAGTYLIQYNIAATMNYKQASGSCEVVIAKANNEVYITPATGLIYNGQEQSLIMQASENSGSDIYFGVNQNVTANNYWTFSTQLPTSKKSGIHMVYYYVPATWNYNEIQGFVEVFVNSVQTGLNINLNGGTWPTIPGEFTQNSGYNYSMMASNGVQVTFPEPVRQGYTFIGWEAVNEGASVDLNGVLIYSQASRQYTYTFGLITINLEAQWRLDVYTIIYEMNGGRWGENYTAPTKYTFNQSITLPKSDEIIKVG
jgi:hypothetical protein